ncbi:uncharacterized protein LOC106876405 [Octopus bimaculoides]|uniref:Chitin-binding type-4 domain-containing protein n=1 Tax=Octopus bimaculoides TaxID=37653 RepID=A0A0L8GK20_OCTBM|nr:uncharacterized protein LOC106876405 [Octopus bimaculoides]|eukprot:XP_014780426.1 PREDICTED: uncharacterized protein LOC106876405 [Octopus bimaculoides]
MNPESISSIFVVLIVTTSIHQVLPHGRLMDPPARNSMWRFGFPNPVNYNDNELYCGGKMVQWMHNKGKCGVCGDPWHGVRHHETGGKYANGIISRSYTEGDNIKVAVHLTANHLGWFEFRICPTNNPETEVTQACLDQHLLYSSDGLNSRFRVTKGKNNVFFNFTIKLPFGLVCEQCVFQWKYRTGNTWDKDDKSGIFCLGCGPQEEFYNCADITIEPLSDQNDYSSISRRKVNSETIDEKGTVGVKITSETIPTFRPTTSATELEQPKGNVKTRKVNLFDWVNQLSLKNGKNQYLLNKDVGHKNADKSKKIFRYNSKITQSTLSLPTEKSIPKLTSLAVPPNRNSHRRLKISKPRADMSAEKIYSKNRKLIETTASIPTVILPKKSFKMFTNPVSPGKNWFVRDHKITAQRSPVATAMPKALLSSKPCHKPKTVRKQVNKVSQIVASPVGRFNLGWWGEHYFKPPATSRIPATWPIKPVLKCRAIILLSGGMDDWCFVNCNANYCPSNLCQCRRELSYAPFYTSSNNHVVEQSLSSHIAEPIHLPLTNRLPSLSSQTNVALPLHNSQYSPGVNRCKAIGLHAGNVHFNQWCNRNCFSFWCPSSLCHCR